MAHLNVGSAATAGFRLIAQKPVAVIVWGFVYMLLSVAMMALFFALGAGEFFQKALQVQPGSAPDPKEMMASMSRLQTINPLIQIGSLVARAILYTAVFRAVLRPQDSGFFYLRLGKSELWQALLIFVMAILIALMFIPAGLIGAAIGFGGWAAASAWVPHPWTGWIQGLAITVAVIAALWGVVWAALRLSLAGPMTFDQGTFRLFESWSLTRGHGVQLFLVFLLLMLIMFGVGLLIDLVFLAGFFAAMGGVGFDPEAMAAMFRQPFSTWWPVVAPWAIVGVVVGSVVTGLVTAIFLAPWADAYRQLKPETSVEGAFT